MTNVPQTVFTVLAAIHGTVMDESGKPISHIEVDSFPFTRPAMHAGMALTANGQTIKEDTISIEWNQASIS